ncbi:MAG: helix-turn-helix transcriptional regulator [Acidimicrobiales bacterium]
MALSERLAQNTSLSHNADTISVQIACSIPLCVQAYNSLFLNDDRFSLVGATRAGLDAVGECVRNGVGLLVAGPSVEGLYGSSLVRTAREALPELRVVLVGHKPDPSDVYDVMAAGARGYLSDREDGPALLQQLWRISMGEIVMADFIAGALAEAVESRPRGDEWPTARELETLRLVAEGRTAREIGETLFVSEATVKTYLHRVYQRLGVGDKGAAVATAMRRGWLT